MSQLSKFLKPGTDGEVDMKGRACALVTAIFVLLSNLEATPGSPQPLAQEKTVTAGGIVAKYLEAIGGIGPLKAIDTKRIRYRVFMFSRDGYLMERLWKRPNTMKTGRPGDAAYTLTEGDGSWRISNEERRELPPSLAASLAKLADIDGPLVDSSAKGISLSYLGAVHYDMTDLYRVQLTFKDGVRWELFFDSRTGLLRKVKRPSFLMVDNEISRGPDTFHHYYDYRPVDDIMIPHLWLQISESHAHAFVVEEVELNRSPDHID